MWALELGTIVIFENILEGEKKNPRYKELKNYFFFPKSKSSHETKCTSQGLSLEGNTNSMERAATH